MRTILRAMIMDEAPDFRMGSIAVEVRDVAAPVLRVSAAIVTEEF